MTVQSYLPYIRDVAVPFGIGVVVGSVALSLPPLVGAGITLSTIVVNRVVDTCLKNCLPQGIHESLFKDASEADAPKVVLAKFLFHTGRISVDLLGGSLIGRVALQALGFSAVPTFGTTFLLLVLATAVGMCVKLLLERKKGQEFAAITTGFALAGWAFDILSPVTCGAIGAGVLVTGMLVARLANKCLGNRAAKILPYVVLGGAAVASVSLSILSVKSVAILSSAFLASLAATGLMRRGFGKDPAAIPPPPPRGAGGPPPLDDSEAKGQEL